MIPFGTNMNSLFDISSSESGFKSILKKKKAVTISKKILTNNFFFEGVFILAW